MAIDSKWMNETLLMDDICSVISRDVHWQSLNDYDMDKPFPVTACLHCFHFVLSLI